MRPLIPFLAWALLLLTGCSEPPVFQADVPMAAEAWNRANKPQFNFTIDDTLNKYDIFVDLRHNGDYPFSSLYLFVDLEARKVELDYDDSLLTADRIRQVLADEDYPVAEMVPL